MPRRNAKGVTSGVGIPHKMFGRDGDITIRKTRQGKIVYIKDGGIWHSINTGIDISKLRDEVNKLSKLSSSPAKDNEGVVTANLINVRKNTSTATVDPQIKFIVGGTEKFTLGVDDDDDDKFKISSPDATKSFVYDGTIAKVVQDNNNGNPVWQLGSSDTECFKMSTTYASGAKGFNKIKLETLTASSTLNEGQISLNVDGEDKLILNDSAHEILVDGATGSDVDSNSQPVGIHIKNKASHASNTNTRSSIRFSQKMSNIVSETFDEVASIVSGSEGTYNTLSSTADGYLSLQTAENGTLNERLKIASDGAVTVDGTITAGGFTTTGTWTFDEYTSGTIGITSVQDSGTTFNDNDTSLMTAAAIADKIEAYGYSTASGDITSVTITTDSGGGSAASDSSGDAAFSILGANGVGVTNSGTTITAAAVPGEIDHDSLNNFVANEHIDWTASSAGTIHASNYSAGASSLDDLSDVTYSSGDLTISSLDKIIASDFVVDSGASVELDSHNGNFVAKKAGTEFSAANSSYAGMILGYTRIQNDGTGTGDALITMDATLSVLQTVTGTDLSVTFKAPPSGNVEIQMIASLYASSKTVELALSDNATFNEVSEIHTYDAGAQSSDETDVNMTTVSFVVTGLTAGSSYTYYIGGAENSSGTSYFRHGRFRTTGTHYPPIIIKAIALPATITTGG